MDEVGMFAGCMAARDAARESITQAPSICQGPSSGTAYTLGAAGRIPTVYNQSARTVGSPPARSRRIVVDVSGRMQNVSETAGPSPSATS